MAETAKNIVGSFREAIQDLLVPEFRALRVSVDSVRTGMQLREDKLQESINAVRTEMQLRDESLRREMQLRDSRTQELIQQLDARTQESICVLSQRLDYAIDIRERLISLEARLSRQ
jgi:hypothetical protein